MAPSRSRPGLLRLLLALLAAALVTFVYLLLSLDHLQPDPRHPSYGQSPGPRPAPDPHARPWSREGATSSPPPTSAESRWPAYKDSIKQDKTYQVEPDEKCNCSTAALLSPALPAATPAFPPVPVGFSDTNAHTPAPNRQFGAEGGHRRGNMGRHVNFYQPGHQHTHTLQGGGWGQREGARRRPEAFSQQSDLRAKIRRASRQLKDVLRLLERIKGELNTTSPSPETLVSARVRSGILVVEKLINSLLPEDRAADSSSAPGALLKEGSSKNSPGSNAQLPFSQTQEQQSKEVFCQETFKGTLFGYPFYEKGFVVDPCADQTRLDQLVTIVVNLVDYPPHLLLDTSRLLRQVRATHPEVALVIAVRRQGVLPQTLRADVAFRLDVEEGAYRPGAVWNTLLTRVTTPYVLLGRQLLRFDGDSGLSRLLREMSSQGLGVVGGATRTADGRWSIACYQVAHRNYTLAYRRGYRHSARECLRCHYVQGPLVVRTDLLRNHPLDESLPATTLFEDYFLTLQQQGVAVALCPDAMFHVRFPDGLQERRVTWSGMATKWRLNRIRLASGVLHAFSCAELHMDCAFTTGLAVAPCCLDLLAEQIKFIMSTCEQYHIVCELQEGTLLGAVKLGKALPWERDGDVTFLSSNFSSLQALGEQFLAGGYVLQEAGGTRCCVEDRLAGGVFTVRGVHSPWTVEMYGYHRTDSDSLLLQGVRPTKVFFDGAWVGAPRNPGRHLRNRYGHEIYRHAQHWISLGKYNGWDEYVPSGFSACPLAGRHDCLDAYSVDGNLQFEEPVP